MSSSLPTDPAYDKAVLDFGVGTYDSDLNSPRGEDSEESPKKSLPGTSLPSDANNPSARSDYYDQMTLGMNGDEWADEDTGVYADSQLPSPDKNETHVDNSLGALGNEWSGYVVEDLVDNPGFPSGEAFNSPPHLRVCSSGNTHMSTHRRATNLGLVGDLTSDFLKKFGKKDLTRRHVMAFLQNCGQPQFLASDIIRCLKLRHSVFVKDVLDEFPVAKVASTGATSLASTRDSIVQLEVDNLANPELASELRRCAASISDVVALLERVGTRNG